MISKPIRLERLTRIPFGMYFLCNYVAHIIILCHLISIPFALDPVMMRKKMMMMIMRRMKRSVLIVDLLVNLDFFNIYLHF